MHPHGHPSCAHWILSGISCCLISGLLVAAAQPGVWQSKLHPTVYLGVAVDVVDPATIQHLPEAQGAGLAVRAVDPGSPADRAGLRRHDLLLQWEDQRLFTPEQLRGLFRTLEPGQTQAMTILRNGIRESREVVFGERRTRAEPARTMRVVSIPYAGWFDVSVLASALADIVEPEFLAGDQPEPSLFDDPERLLGFVTDPVDPALMAQLQLGYQAGAVVRAILPGSAADNAGLQWGDIVVGLQGNAIDPSGSLVQQLAGHLAASPLTILVRRAGHDTELSLYLAVPVMPRPGDLPPEAPRAISMDRDWAAVLGNDVDWVILLEQTAAAAPPEIAPPVSQDFRPPRETLDWAAGPGTFPLAEGRGSMEVLRRGGRDHFIVRNAQGSILYQGPIQSEADRLWLRTLRPDLRQSAESIIDSQSALPHPVELQVRRWSLPPRYL